MQAGSKMPTPLTVPRHRNGRPAAFRAGLLREPDSFCGVCSKVGFFWIFLADGKYGICRFGSFRAKSVLLPAVIRALLAWEFDTDIARRFS